MRKSGHLDVQALTEQATSGADHNSTIPSLLTRSCELPAGAINLAVLEAGKKDTTRGTVTLKRNPLELQIRVWGQ